MATSDPITTGNITWSGVGTGTTTQPFVGGVSTGGNIIIDNSPNALEWTVEPSASKADIDKLNEEIIELRWQLACMASDFKEAMAAVAKLTKLLGKGQNQISQTAKPLEAGPSGPVSVDMD